MNIPKVSWRKPPNPKKGAVIRTRPIFPAAFPAVKNHAIQRGSVRTICPANGRTEQPREGRGRHCYQFQPMPLPGSHVILICLQNPMLVDTLTHSSSHKLSYSNAQSFCVRPCFNANCVAIALEVYVNRDLHTWEIKAKTIDRPGAHHTGAVFGEIGGKSMKRVKPGTVNIAPSTPGFCRGARLGREALTLRHASRIAPGRTA